MTARHSDTAAPLSHIVRRLDMIRATHRNIVAARDQEIASLYATGDYSLRALASITGLNHQTVANIVERQS